MQNLSSHGIASYDSLCYHNPYGTRYNERRNITRTALSEKARDVLTYFHHTLLWCKKKGGYNVGKNCRKMFVRVGSSLFKRTLNLGRSVLLLIRGGTFVLFVGGRCVKRIQNFLRQHTSDGDFSKLLDGRFLDLLYTAKVAE